MAMRRKLTKSEYVLSALFAFVAAFPLATSPSGRSFDVAPLATVANRDFLKLIETQRLNDRVFADVERLCRKKTAQNPDTVCPDINDAKSVRLFLQGHSLKAKTVVTGSVIMMSGAALDPVDSILDLADSQRAMLRRFHRVGTCPQGLDAIIPGFQNVCEEEIRGLPHMIRRMVEKRVPQTGMLQEDDDGTRMNMRIEMFDGARPDR